MTAPYSNIKTTWKRTFTFWLICFFGHTSAVEASTVFSYLSLQDTIFIRVNDMGIKTHRHIYQANQSLPALAEFYSISMDELRFFNPTVNENSTKVGVQIIVPIPNRAIIRYNNAKNYNASTCIPVYHTVKRGETLYRLSKKYYSMPQEEIMQRNQLEHINLKEGQVLHIGWLDIKGIPPAREGEITNPILKANLSYRNAYFAQINVKEEWEHKGLAARQNGGKLASGFVVYHAYAKMKSYIRITNPMTKRTIYAQVIGRIPISLQHKYAGKDVVLAYSPTIGKALGVIDPQFFVSIRFVK